jgi:hypothetical protein
MKVSGFTLGVFVLSFSNQKDCFSIKIFEKEKRIFPRNMIFV